MWLSAYMGLEFFGFFNHEICKQDAKLGDFSDGGRSTEGFYRKPVWL
jgi:hypothetical protein